MDILIEEGVLVPYSIMGASAVIIPMINIGSGIMELLFPIESLNLYHGRTIDENSDDTILYSKLIAMLKIAVNIF